MSKLKIETTLNQYKEAEALMLELAKLEASITETEAEMNAELAKVQAKYKKISKEKIEKKNGILANLEQFCDKNKKDFFVKGKPKTLKLNYGSLSFRMGTGAIVLLRKVKDGFKKAAYDLKEMYQNRYVRVVYEVNKERLIDDYNSNKIGDIELASVNLRYDKSDKFNCKLNWKSLEKAGVSIKKKS